MECQNCGGSFSTEEAVEIRGTNRYKNKQVVIAHECPMCGEALSMQFTRQWNTERCSHSATVDGDGPDGFVEICSECGLHLSSSGKNGSIKEAWAIPAAENMRMDTSDAEEYWGDK